MSYIYQKSQKRWKKIFFAPVAAVFRPKKRAPWDDNSAEKHLENGNIPISANLEAMDRGVTRLENSQIARNLLISTHTKS